MEGNILGWKEFMNYKVFVKTFFSLAYSCIYESTVKEKSERKDLADHVLDLAYTDVSKFTEEKKQSIENPYQYIRTIVYNKAMNENKKNWNNSKAEPLEIQDEPSVSPAYNKYDINAIKSEIKKRNKQWAQILELLSQGYQYEEIKEKLNIPLNTVKSSVSRIRRIIKSL
jgi:DNA-directed RNA polymerase specialized sigma24 family protein